MVTKSFGARIRDYGQLGLLFVGFLTGIGLVITCGGGGSGAQSSTSTSSTISFTPFFFNVNDPATANAANPTGLPVGVPPVLNNVTNVQDALNRLNAVLSPDLARITDPLSADFVGEANIPQVLVDPGDPNDPTDDFILTFSRGLSGLVRSTSLAGPLRADEAFFLSCDEMQASTNVLFAPLVARIFCADDGVATDPSDDAGVFELFAPSTINGVPQLSGPGTGRLPATVTRVRIDGADSSITGFVPGGGGTQAYRIDGVTGNITGSGSLSIGGAGAFGGSVTSMGSVTAGNNLNATAGNVTAGNNVAAGNDVTAGGNVSATNDVTAGNDVTATQNVTATMGNVSATAGDVTAGNDVVAANNVTATNGDLQAPAGNVTTGGNVTAGGDLNATGNVNTTNVNATGSLNGATASITGALTAGDVAATAGNVTASGNVSGTDVMASNNVTAGADVSATNNVTAGADVMATGNMTAGINVSAGGDVSATGNVVAGTNVTATAGNVSAGNDVTATNNVAAGADVMAGGIARAGNDPTIVTNVGAQMDGAFGLATLRSLTSAAFLIGNEDIAANNNQILEVRDQSVESGTGMKHLLVTAGEKDGAGTDGNGILRVFDSSQATRIILDGETGTLTADILNVTTQNVMNQTVMNLDVSGMLNVNPGGATPIVLDGSTGDVTASGAVSAATDVVATNNLTAGADVAAANNVTATTGNVSAPAGNVNAGVDVTAANDVIAANNVTATAGNVAATAGNVTAGADVVAANNVTATAGNVTATAGNVVATAGDVMAGNDVTAGANVTAGGNVAAAGNVSAGTGANMVTLDATTGAVTATGDLNSTNVAATTNVAAGAGATLITLDGTTGNVSAANDVNASNDVNATNNVNATVNVSAGADVTAVGNIDAGGAVGSVNGANRVAALSKDGSSHGTMTLTDATGATTLVAAGRDPASAGGDDGILEVFDNGASVIQLNGNNGDVAGITKSFVQPHPVDPTLEIHYTALEGPENGVYVRGRGRLIDGRAVISLPENFTLVAATEGLTVHLTPMGECNGLFAPIQQLSRTGFEVKELMGGRSNVSFSWTVHGLRRGMEDHETIRPNRFFRPRIKDATFMDGLPGLQSLMIESGLLNADGTPNQELFQALGWELKTKEESRQARR